MDQKKNKSVAASMLDDAGLASGDVLAVAPTCSYLLRFSSVHMLANSLPEVKRKIPPTSALVVSK